MPKKPEFARGNKSDKEHSPMKDRTQNQGGERRLTMGAVTRKWTVK